MKNALRLALAAASIMVIGQGCAPAPELPAAPPEAMEKKEGDAVAPKEGEAMMEKEGDKMMKADLKPYYIAYTSGQAAAALKEGRGIVYYFWAGWCPICRAEEPKLQGRIENSGLPIAGFRVNYDTESDLKKKYKIPYQHTTVFLNAAGEEVERFSGPVDEATFLAALKKASR